MKLVITGGHHSSAIPLIHKIQKDHKEIEIYWIGHRHSLKDDMHDSLEYKEITNLGVKFYELKTGKVYRAVTVKNLTLVGSGLFDSWKLLKDIKPDLILSFGGYLAVPVVVAGWILNIPSITHEQTAVAGYANRVIAKFVKKILISWRESEKYFPAGKTVFTGLPLREAIFTAGNENYSSGNDLPYIFILGGKSGSHLINEIVKDSLMPLLSVANIIHQCGDYSVTDDFSEINKKYLQFQNKVSGKLFLSKFILEDQIGTAYGLATLVVSRAGAHTTGEIMALEKPALLIPISWVSHNEQYKNAQIVKNTGLAEILEEKDLTAENFVQKIKYMLHNLNYYKNKTALKMPKLVLNPVQLILDEILKYA